MIWFLDMLIKNLSYKKECDIDICKDWVFIRIDEIDICVDNIIFFTY